MDQAVRLTILREILRYVPSFRDRLFVIAFDGDVLTEASFSNLLLDVALLRSLNIKVVVTFSAGPQIQALAQQLRLGNVELDVTGPVDELSHRVGLLGLWQAGQLILQGLNSTDVPAVLSPAVVAHPAGIRRGVDWLYAGRVDRIESSLLQPLLGASLVPVVPPVGFDGEGHSYRVNAETVAAELAGSLRAAKLLFVTRERGLVRQGELVRQLPLAEAEEWLARSADELPPPLRLKLEQGCRACRMGVERVHIVSGLIEEGLLAEVFSPQGIGTLIHRDEYAAIRRARRKDAPPIYRLLKPLMETEEVRRRTLDEIRGDLDKYLVYDLDGVVVGCVAVYFYPDTAQAELASLAVDQAHENQGIGRKLLEYAQREAQKLGAREVFVLSTQAYNYFRQKGGFVDASPDILPPSRRKLWEASGRNSRILKKSL